MLSYNHGGALAAGGCTEMDLKLLREPVVRQRPSYGAASTQVYRWPSPLTKMNVILPILTALIAFAAVYGIRSGMVIGDDTRVALGIAGAVGAAAVLTVLCLIHFVAAREVRFTRDSLVIKQTGRRRMVLPYCAYKREWVMDDSGGEGSLRILMFERNRGCIVLMAPQWLRVALHEVARIQEEEGWYTPDRP